jgi:hypothetical protein
MVTAVKISNQKNEHAYAPPFLKLQFKGDTFACHWKFSWCGPIDSSHLWKRNTLFSVDSWFANFVNYEDNKELI